MPGTRLLRWSRTISRPVRWLAIVAGAILAFLLVLALVLGVGANRWIRRALEAQAAQAIPGATSIGALEISLFGLSATVRDPVIRSREPGSKPALEVGKLRVALARLPLLAGRVVVDEIEIEAPVVRLVREPSGELDLLKLLLPETPKTQSPPEPPSRPVPIRLRKILLGAGRVEFVDRARPHARPLRIELPAAKIENVVVTGEPGRDPSDLHLEIRSEGASIDVDGTFHRTDERLDVDATVDARKVPLERVWVYLPDLGWSKLEGELDAKIHYLHATGAKQAASGSIALRELQIVVPRLADPALSIGSLALELEELDLIERRLALGQVTLVKPRFFFDPIERSRLLLLPNGIPGAGEPPRPGDPPPFSWSLAGLKLEGAQLAPIGEGLAPLVLDARIGAIASAQGGPADVTLRLTQGAGAATVDGKLEVSPPGFRGEIALDALALAPLLRVAAAGLGPRLEGGVASGKLDVKLGSLAAEERPAPGGDLRVSGALTLEKLEGSSDAEGTLGAKVEKLELALQPLDLPGVLPSTPQPHAPAAPRAAEAGSAAPEPASAEPAAPEAAGSEPAAPEPAGPAPTPEPPAMPPLRREAPADAGTLRLAGSLRLRGVSARSARGEPFTLALESLDLDRMQLELPGLLPPAQPPATPRSAGRLRFATALGLAGLQLDSGREREFGLALDRLDAGVREVEVPGLLAVAGASSPHEPPRVVLAGVRLEAPALRLTRGEQGMLWPASPGQERPAQAVRDAARGEARDVAAGAPGLRLEIGSLALERGSVRFVDRTVKPFYQGAVTGVTLGLRDVALPGLRFRDASLQLSAPGPASAWVLGSWTPASRWFEGELEKLPLAPLNPYARSAFGYFVNGGELSLYSKGSLANGHLYAANWITVYDADVSGGSADSPLEKALGVPVSLAISLLKDPRGDIGLSVPIDYDESGASVRLVSVIGSALQGVLIGALTSPLKLLGAVVDPSGKVRDATPEPIHFLPGRAELGVGDDERVAALAKLSATRPGLVLRLSGQTAGADAQFLREAKLLDAIDSGVGLPEQAQGLTRTLLRRRIRTALQARLEGKPAELEPEDAELLAQWLGELEVGPEALPELARRRALRVQELLQQGFGVDPAQIQQAEPGPAGAAPEPAVDVSIAS